MHPILPVRPKMMFGSVLEHSPNIQHEKSCKTFVRRRMHYFGVPNFWKMFYHECIQSNLLDPKQCLGLFPSILQNFATKKSCKTCVSGLKALFRGNELSTKVFPRTPPIQPVRPKTKFGSVSEHFQ